MELQQLFEMQEVLGERIKKEKGLEGRDLLPEKILALQVELGELANEWRGFKFWSENQEPRNKIEIQKDCEHCKGVGYFPSDNEITEEICAVCKGLGQFLVGYKNPLLEEYVDCLHFILSIGNGLKITPISVMAVRGDYGLTFHILDLFDMICLFRDGSYEDQEWKYKKLLKNFVGLGEMLGFTWEQIEQAYYDKNKVNHKRQENGY